ncbi:transcription elongation factor GreA [Xylocopilactobacillus apicola]|uniref:Transcription elongation factor GreA n=1 Tax=Xylocopilactobacillus apicola TaxID=2932184 RepID=A0AAU9CWW2_9LACO|nr:transcription elongation factor GreA [Xylocopilactobacillus apicola]BDR58477.1 transcription elongation factor GreA [Xylocopilactobacillus apicola]
MEPKTYPMTKDGKKKLEKELDNLRQVKRPEIINRIKIARSYGDLSENSEYTSAKDEQSALESRISTLENMLRFAKIVEPSELEKNTVGIGKTVEFLNITDNETESYKIVSSVEADPFKSKISVESPIATALNGKKVNDEVLIETPGGTIKVKITKVK